MTSATKLAMLLRLHRAPLSVAAVALLAFGTLFATQAYAATQSETFTRHDTRWSEEASFEYGVPVTRNATVWANGSYVPMGQPAYYRTISDKVLVNFSWRAAGIDGATGIAQADMVLHIRAQTPQGKAYWEVRHTLASGVFDDPTAPIELRGVLDLDALVAETNLLTQRLPLGDGRVNWTVESVVTYAFTREGNSNEAGKAAYDLPLTITDPRIGLPSPDDITWARPHQTTTTSVVTTPSGWAGALGSLRALLLLASGAALLTGVLWASARDPERGLVPRDIAFLREHEQHRDWVTRTRGQVATRPGAPTIDVASLEDLVQVAADARARVLLDGDSRIYYALLPGVTYRYARHAARVQAPTKPVSPVGR